MSEASKPKFESGVENIPTIEELKGLMVELIGGVNFTEIRKLEDEKGLYIYDVRIPGNAANREIGYEYIRKGRYKEGESSTTTISKVYYEDGVVNDADTVADCVDGKWVKV